MDWFMYSFVLEKTPLDYHFYQLQLFSGDCFFLHNLTLLNFFLQVFNLIKNFIIFFLIKNLSFIRIPFP